MNVQLLLLLALVGPFCAFTHANPTPLPTQLDVGITETAAEGAPDTTEGPKDDLTVFTGPPSTEVAAAPEVLATEAVTAAALPPATVNTEEPVVETDAPVAAATAAAAVPEPEPEPEPLNTDPPAVVTAAPTVTAEIEDEPVATAGAKVEDNEEDVVVEEGTDDGLTSGQVVGIVIGALLAVIIVIAVVIAAVRRMGKYSP